MTTIYAASAKPCCLSKALRAPSRRPALLCRQTWNGHSSTGFLVDPVMRGNTLCTRATEDEDKKVLTREAEPDEYWQSAAEKKGVSPFKDPLAIMGVVGILFPFILLGIAIAAGYVDLSNYKR